MSVCKAQGRALKGRVSLLWRVTEQSDGPQRAENNSYFLCTPRRQDCSTPYTSPPLPIKPLFLPAFISERQTLSGVHFSIFLCGNYLFFLSLLCARTHLYIYIPLQPTTMVSRSRISNVHTLFCQSGTFVTQAGAPVQWKASTPLDTMSAFTVQVMFNIFLCQDRCFCFFFEESSPIFCPPSPNKEIGMEAQTFYTINYTSSPPFVPTLWKTSTLLRRCQQKPKLLNIYNNKKVNCKQSAPNEMLSQP